MTFAPPTDSNTSGIPTPITSIPPMDSSTPVAPHATTQNDNAAPNVVMSTETAANALRDRALVNALRSIPTYL